ncbi:unnamed protein product [Brassica oleracea var. botrytis]|uniref:Uncharacterized protein n=2 Tax=Brassica oleracea TaxID=3712 RepID=A0A0D3A8D9_BRAOL|nr:unnamed protein product [Brassica oleracea]
MAFEDEIQGARNFLIQQYAGHKPSVDAIESAHDKIIMQKFHERKNPKIDITKKVRQVRQAVQSCELCFREIPSSSHCFSCQNGSHVRSSRRSDGSVPDSAGFVISSTYVLLHPALVFPLRDGIFRLLVADWDLLDGICDPTVHQRTKRFRSHVFAHKLRYALGGFELP